MMKHAGPLLCCLLFTSASAEFAATQPAADLDALTVPPGMLAAGCALIEAAWERTAQGHVRSGLWAGLGIRSNPWAGGDPRVLFEIRTRMFGLDRLPDAPPDLQTAAQIERSLVEGM